MSISADDLFAAMQTGAKVEYRWKRPSPVRRRRQLVLTYPDGEQQIIQHSCLKPLISKGLVVTEVWSGSEYVYRLVE